MHQIDNMNLNSFTAPQKQALLDLATLAMYADGHLAATEDARVLRLLGLMGFSDSERDRAYDAAISRVGRHSQNVESARAYAATLAQTFTTREQRRTVQQTLEDVVSSDRHVSIQENDFLALATEALQK
jgi:uncharacterized tellurite resistance protein B-like protein